MQGSGEFGAGGFDRDNRCGECGVSMGQVHRSNCRTGIAFAESTVSMSAVRDYVSSDLFRELGEQRVRQYHPELIDSVDWNEIGLFAPEFDSAQVVERVIYSNRPEPHSAGHGPESHGPEFWTSGCTDSACVAYRQNEQRKAWLLQQPEHVALVNERSTIMRMLNELASSWDWDAWYDGEWDAMQWSAKAINEIYRILGLEVPKP